jgi:hypothetical protein
MSDGLLPPSPPAATSVGFAEHVSIVIFWTTVSRSYQLLSISIRRTEQLLRLHDGFDAF